MNHARVLADPPEPRVLGVDPLLHGASVDVGPRVERLGRHLVHPRFEGGQTVAAKLLFHARSAGLETSVDMVSATHPQFREIALSSLPLTDHLVLNEIEADLICHVHGCIDIDDTDLLT